MKNKTRIEWLDGLKGIACILIFIHHFFLAFYPAIHYGNNVPSKLNGIDNLLSTSPLSVILNGNFLVALFCIISGIVISVQIMSIKDKQKISEVIFKRYFRLMLPLFPIGILVYLMLKFNLFNNVEVANYTNSPWLAQYYNNSISFMETLKLIFIDTWFYGSDILSNAYWMLSQLFYGTFLSIILSMISWKYNKHTWLIYLTLAIFLIDGNTLAVSFILGTLIAWLYKNKLIISNRYIGFVSLIIGIFLGGYPSSVIPNNIYSFLNFETYVTWHIVGAFLTIYGIWNCQLLQKILSLNIFQKLGSISYSLYLIHIPLLFSITTFIFIKIINIGYFYSTLITFILSIVILIIISYFYNKYIEKISLFIQNKVLNYFTN